MNFRLPQGGEHVSVFGRTGSGKTQAGAWILSTRDLKEKPYVIIDYKGDELLNSISRVRDIGYKDVPSEPGLYILKAHPSDKEPMENWLLKIWEKGDTGLYFDEGYMVPDENNLTGIFTQGRSLNIPVIMLSQRPAWLNRFAFSEASHFMVFHLNDKRDQQNVREFTPPGFLDMQLSEKDKDLEKGLENPESGRLPKYHSRWYNVNDDLAFVMKPVPSADEIRDKIESQLEIKKRWL